MACALAFIPIIGAFADSGGNSVSPSDVSASDAVSSSDTTSSSVVSSSDTTSGESELVMSVYSTPMLTATSDYASGSGTEEDPYIIKTAAQLKTLSTNVNNGTLYSGVYFKLANDISLSSYGNWIPIGASSTPFLGVFDGNNCTISNLKISRITGWGGLFGCVGSGGTVKNLAVSGSVTEYSSGYTGGIVAYASGTISNCSFSGTVSGKTYVGGVVGFVNSNGTVTGCTNSGSVTGSDQVGGVVGYTYCTVTGCTNSGTVTGSGSEVGGVAGHVGGTVSGCVNSGSVKGGSEVGGVAGYTYGGTVTNCYNIGTVSGTRAGGVVGYAYINAISGIKSKISNCYSVGTVSGTTSGGAIGHAYSTTISNTYYLNTSASSGIGSNYDSGSVTSKTSTEFASGEVAYLLNGSVSGGTTWYQNIDSGTADSYPVLSSTHGTVYAETAYKCDGTTVISRSYTNSSEVKDTTPDHTWDEGEVTTEATCTKVGVMTYTCTVCGETKTEEIPATGHTLVNAVKENEVAATCTENGSYDMVVYCSVCGEELSRTTVTVSTSGHVYVAIVTAPTCTEGGYTTHTCYICGDSYTDNETEATGHTAAEAVTENEIAATCTENGSYDSVVYCSVCGEEVSRETVTVAATGHSYEAVVTAPTCTEGGYTTYTCSVCGDSYTADETEATGHSYTSEVTKEPTYTEKGVRTYTCTDCGDTYTEEIDKLVDETAPTASIEISTNKWTEFLSTITFGIFFNETQDVTIDASDSESGVSGIYYYISSEALTEDEVMVLDDWTEYTGKFSIDPDGEYVIYAKAVDIVGNTTYASSTGLVLETIAPTIDGLEDNKTYCAAVTFTVSDDNFAYIDVDGEQIAEAEYTLAADGSDYTVTAYDKAGNASLTYTVTVNDGHTYGEPTFEWAEDGSSCTATFACDFCDDEQTVDADIESEVTTEPTCTDKGITTYTAKVTFNDTEYTDALELADVPANGHTYETEVTDPTCTRDGYTTYTCSVCGDTFTDNYTDATGHTTEIQNAKDATCTEDGYTGDEVCTVCSETVASGEIIPATGHSYTSVITKKPTYTEEGERLYTCTLCGDSYTEAIAVLEEEKVEISIIDEGTDGEYTLTSGETASIHCTGELSKFLNAYVDGALVDSSNYTLAEGSTILTFTNDYLETLTVGDHEVTLTYTNGSVTTTLTVLAASTGDDSSSVSPGTGDDFSAAPFVAAMVLAGVIIAICAVYFVRKRKSRA